MLRLDHLRKSFGALVAVDDLSLGVVKGEVFGLLGPNGAGKTTTIGMAIGLIAPDAGTVSIDGGGGPAHPAARARIGVAPQSLALYDDLSGEANVRFFARLFGLGGKRLSERTRDVLERVGLTDRRRDPVRAYSGGMKRRLNLAVALVHDPPLLLLDEPTAGVDPQSRNSILELVRALAVEGRTIVYTTHYMEEAQKVCDRVGIMDKGKLLALGSVNELIHAHGGRSVVTIERDGGEQRLETANPLAEISRVMNDGATVRGVRIDRPDLESVFLALTGRTLRD